MRLYFVRHGESEANLAREFSNRGFKHPLTPRGVTQATELAARLAGRGITQIYTSPLRRAAQTAEILAEVWDLPVTVADALREWDVGDYEGTSDPRGWELHRWVQEEWFLHRRLEQRMPGGESFLDIQARFVPFLDDLVRAPDREALLLVGHGGLYHAMLPTVLANIDYALVERRPMNPTDYVLAETSADGLSCRIWCGVALEQEARDEACAGGGLDARPGVPLGGAPGIGPRRDMGMATMSDEQKLRLLELFAEAWNRHDLETLMECMTDDCVFEASAGPDVCGMYHAGQREVRAAFAGVFATFPDAQWRGARHVVAGDRGVSEWTFTGTREDGARIEVNGCDLLTFRDGKIAIKNSYRKNRPPLGPATA